MLPENNGDYSVSDYLCTETDLFFYFECRSKIHCQPSIKDVQKTFVLGKANKNTKRRYGVTAVVKCLRVAERTEIPGFIWETPEWKSPVYNIIYVNNPHNVILFLDFINLLGWFSRLFQDKFALKVTQISEEIVFKNRDVRKAMAKLVAEVHKDW